MMSSIKTLLQIFGVDTRALWHNVSSASIRAALREQGLGRLAGELRQIVPDLREQYTESLESESYDRIWELKMRGMHAFQIQASLDAIEHIGARGLVVVDIGDSSGNHGKYLKALDTEGKIARFLGVNLDPAAIAKIEAGGGDALLCRAEKLSERGIHADLFICFETLEHLTDPVRFLHALSDDEGNRGFILVTVPFTRTSRFGSLDLRKFRSGDTFPLTAERVHMFELRPEDWVTLARFAGFKTVFSRIYRQYPRHSPLRTMQPVWRKLDFEGFLCLFLERDQTMSSRYADW